MLCTLKVRRTPDPHKDDSQYWLRISSKHAVGGAGGLIYDEASYSTLPRLLETLRDIQVPAEYLSATSAALEIESSGHRWLPVGADLQIPFETLAAAGFYLQDESD